MEDKREILSSMYWEALELVPEYKSDLGTELKKALIETFEVRVDNLLLEKDISNCKSETCKCKKT